MDRSLETAVTIALLSFSLCFISFSHQHNQTFAYSHTHAEEKKIQTNNVHGASFAVSETFKVGSPPGIARFVSFVPISYNIN